MLGAVRDVILAPRFTPLSIPGCVLWLDAARIAGADGDAITVWPDSSPSAQNATPGTSPTLKTGIVNGRSVGRFVAASSQYLTNAAWNKADGLTGYTTFAVFKVANPALGAGQMVCALQGSKARLGNISTNLAYIITSGTTYASSAYTSTAWNIQSVVYDGSLVGDARLIAFYNGVAASLTYVGAQPASLGSGAGYDVGRLYGSATQLLDGDAATALIYNRALTTAERRRVEAYLGSRFGVAVV